MTSSPSTTGRRGVAVVTGASSGIGAATARRLAADGFAVVAAARRVDRLDALAAEHPAITALELDVTDPGSVAAFAAAVPVCSVLVNNAGGSYDLAPVATGDPAIWEQTYDVNVVGTLRVTQALLPSMLAGASDDRTATVVLLGSTAGHSVYEGGAATPRPSTPWRPWPPRCGWSSTGSPCASPRSRRGWCAPTSSH